MQRASAFVVYEYVMKDFGHAYYFHLEGDELLSAISIAHKKKITEFFFINKHRLI